MPAATDLPVSFADIESAAERLEGVARRTPVTTSRTFNERAGCEALFKCENFQRMGAFKFRGAYNAMSRLSDEQKARGVLAFSSGNHAQAVALSGRLLGIRTTIVMPTDAPQVKLDATRGYGAEVVIYDRARTQREELGAQIASEQGQIVIPPFDHPHVIAGQGTSAKELFEQVGELDALLVCVGGGGLISGCALAAKHLSPGCRVIGVEPEAGDDACRSFREGRIVTIDDPQTIADGARTIAIGELTFQIIRACVHDMTTMPDDALVRTMWFFAERMKMVVEPTGCLAASAVLEKKLDLQGARVGILISGGNVDLMRMGELFSATQLLR